MTRTVAILATVDTKGAEAAFLKEEIESLGGSAMIINLGVMDQPTIPVDIAVEEVVARGGGDFAALRKEPSRSAFNPFLVGGAIKILLEKIQSGEVNAVLSMGGTQGTSMTSAIMQALPYGFGKLIVSTAASGDTAPFVGIKDITMMFSVGDILGLNPFLRKILANAAGAAYGMALASGRTIEPEAGCKGLIGMTNLGVLTKGAMHAIDLFHQAGYEVITFHAIGSGGRAMEQMAEEGLLAGIFDYALGDVADTCYGALRSTDAHRLTVAGKLTLPQVVVPGGTEHLGLLVAENTVPEEYKDHLMTWHSPVIFVPRLTGDESRKVAEAIGQRLSHTTAKAAFMIPLKGVSRYSTAGGELHDPASDAAFFQALREQLPKSMPIEEFDNGAEDDAFVEACVSKLISIIEN